MKTLILSNKDRDEFIRRMQLIDCDKKRFVAEFKIYKKVRSLSQNRLLFLWLNCIKDETGTDVDELHDFFKEKFLPWQSKEVFGVEIKRHSTTTDMDTKEFTDYLEQIRMFALEQGIFLPQPGEYGWEEFYLHYSK